MANHDTHEISLGFVDLIHLESVLCYYLVVVCKEDMEKDTERWCAIDGIRGSVRLGIERLKPKEEEEAAMEPGEIRVIPLPIYQYEIHCHQHFEPLEVEADEVVESEHGFTFRCNGIFQGFYGHGMIERVELVVPLIDPEKEKAAYAAAERLGVK